MSKMATSSLYREWQRFETLPVMKASSGETYDGT